MATKRSYGEACRFAHALDLVGERWALLVVRELLLGPKRFTDLREGLPHASTNILAERLRELEQGGVVQRASCRRRRLRGLRADRVGPGAGAGRDPARRLGRPLAVPARLAGDRPRLDRPRPALAVRPRGRRRPEATYELRLGEDRFRVVVSDGELEPRRGAAGDADAAIAVPTPPPSPRSSPASSPSTGRGRDRGRQAAAKRFLRLFPMPEPCPAQARRTQRSRRPSLRPRLSRFARARLGR